MATRPVAGKRGKGKGKERDRVVIEVKDLWVSYDDIVILEGVDLTVKKGDYLGIIGPNGGGKTTLLKAILGLVPPIRGTVRVLGQPPDVGRRHIGYVPQHTHFDKDFPISVWDVVMMGRLTTGGGWRIWSSREDREAARKALEAVDMLDHRASHIDALSGGQKQRVFIARALASDPSILLLDEPTASVDRHIQASIYELLAELRKRMTIVLVTHDIGVISSYVDRIGCLNHRLHVHDEKHLTKDMLEETYQCPVELIAHGVPHRVFEEH